MPGKAAPSSPLPCPGPDLPGARPRPLPGNGFSWLRKAVGVGCALVIAAIWLITLQRIDAEREQALSAAERSNSNLAIALEEQLQRILGSTELLAAFVREAYLREGEALDLPALASQRVFAEHAFLLISVINEEGKLILSSAPRLNLTRDYRQHPGFVSQQQDGSDQLMISPVELGGDPPTWRIPLSLPIKGDDGRFAGVVVISLPPASLSSFYQEADLGQEFLLEVSSLDGTVFTRKLATGEFSGHEARPLSWNDHQPLEKAGKFIDDGRTIDGTSRLLSYRKLDAYPLLVSIGSGEQETLAAFSQLKQIYLLMAAAGSFGFILAGSLLIRSLQQQEHASAALGLSEAVFRATFNQAAMGIAHITHSGKILNANQKLCELLGLPLNELRGHKLPEFRDPEINTPNATLKPDQYPTAAREVAYRRPDKSLQWVLEAHSLVRGQKDEEDFLVVVMYDINPRKELEARLSHAALHDTLTGLPNRRLFTQRLEAELSEARRHGKQLGILFIDLDGFKSVNDSLGHAAGDEVLIRTAQRLRACVRKEDIAARFGGDEFGMLIVAPTHANDAEAVARKIIHALAQPLEIGRQRVIVSASVGIASYPTHGNDPEALLKLADAAMYAAKNTGKNQFRWSPPPTAYRER